MNKYILDANGEPKLEPSTYKWCRWMETEERIVRQDKLVNGAVVSTVFLGLDHSYFGFTLFPILWETMIFNCPQLEDYQERYDSKADALEGHQRAIEAVDLIEKGGK